ncbi:hypothetical protein IDH08_04480 [Pelagibacterales bacterium SAG-MED22]|nr:hypothetical protein [Pelagibacterales bacterium SAG-MED22]
MFDQLQIKIQNSKIILSPFPHFVIENFLPKSDLNNLNKVLPCYEDINKKQVIFQSLSETKKTVMPDSKLFRALLKKKNFKKVNNVLKKIKPLILLKFKNQILKHVNTKFLNTKIKYNMNFAVMKKGYLKSPHLDRRDHLISGIYYPTSDINKGGNLQMYKNIKETEIFDIFPSKKNIKLVKNYKINKNFCVFFLNVPGAYHAVSKYKGEIDRKYFYIDYDFDLMESSSKTKNRKKGQNNNSFWKTHVKVKSNSRKNNFFTE